MKERPILFSGQMVQAILDGRKTQTRRVVKGKWLPLVEEVLSTNGKWALSTVDYDLTTPYGRPGSHLWVREKWGWSTLASMHPDPSYPQFLMFPDECLTSDGGAYVRWRPSIHMLRWASRITLEIINVRAERLQDISEEDAVAEGVAVIPPAAFVGTMGNFYTDSRRAFRDIWNSINAKRGFGWDSNPWVWVIELRRIKP